jgi:hypothetical protein
MNHVVRHKPEIYYLKSKITRCASVTEIRIRQGDSTELSNIPVGVEAGWSYESAGFCFGGRRFRKPTTQRGEYDQPGILQTFLRSLEYRQLGRHGPCLRVIEKVSDLYTLQRLI